MKKKWAIVFFGLWLYQLLPAQISIGDSAKSFILPDFSGHPVSLDQYAGEIILLNFFASWCPPCQVEAPQLEDSIWQVYQNDGVTVLGVDFQETSSIVSQFMQQNQLTYPVVLDTDGSVFSTYGFTILPSNVLIGRDGNIVWIEEGFNIPRFVHLVDSLVNTSSSKPPPHGNFIAGSFELQSIYPNPFNNTTNVLIEIFEAGSITLKINDITGREFFTRTLTLGVGEYQLPLSFPSRASGLYFLSIQGRNQTKVSKIVYQK
jgi:peroxiredoxin